MAKKIEFYNREKEVKEIMDLLDAEPSRHLRTEHCMRSGNGMLRSQGDATQMMGLNL